MSVINNSLREFEASLQAPPPIPTIDHAEAAREQVAQLGDNPTSTQLTTLMVTMLNENKHEAQRSRDLLSQHLHVTMNTVSQHDTEITELKGNMKTAGEAINQFSSTQSNILERLAAVEFITKNKNLAAAETKQRSLKGNFIISGDMIPPAEPNENLYQLLFPVIYQKYGIYIYQQELKALHRLPGNKVIFSILTRLPGQNFEYLMRAINSNPEPHIKLYISSQLTQPYSELYYIARRLKHHQLINRYRIDENGNTHIAFAEHLMAFKFTGFDQLRQFKINIPQQLIDEANRRAAQIAESEEKSTTLNNQRATQQRPNFIPRTPGPNTRPTQPNSSTTSPAQLVTRGSAQPTGQPAPQPPGVPAPSAHTANVQQHPPQNPSTHPRTANSEFSATENLSHPPDRHQRNQNLSFSNPPPHRSQLRANMSPDGRPPPSKYQRPSYSPTNFPNPASFVTSPPPDRRSTPSGSGFPAASPGTSRTWHSASGLVHTNPSTHRVSPKTYFGM
jgi:hypothetical protein